MSAAAPRGEREMYRDAEHLLEPLPNAAKEAAAVAGIYGARPLPGEAATEAAVRARIGRADVVHLATHGFLHPVVAMSSGILLAAPSDTGSVASAASPEPSTDNDGVLQAWEIQTQLNLRAELVVLSACETGLGGKVAGEGLVGLTRALQVA